MPTWSEILGEINELANQKDPAPLDNVRRKYLAQLAEHTGRDTILYASNWTAPSSAPPGLISITDEDLQGFMEVIYGLKRERLDIVLHSPGGSPEAAEAIVCYVRAKFKHVRVIVPQAAMSAATLMSCAADTIVLGKHSSLGPIDPQMILMTPLGIRFVPAQAILDQFAMAKDEGKNQAHLGSWMPILSQYGPALLMECKNALDLSKRLATDWLAKYMFVQRKSAKALAGTIAATLAAHGRYKSHSRHIDRAQASQMGFVVEELEKDQKLQDLVLSVFHAATHTFNHTTVVKIIENHNGRCFLKATPQKSA